MKVPHIPCEEAIINVEKSFWQRLNLLDWVKTRWHMILCKNCSQYEKDSKILHRILRSMKNSQKHIHLHPEEILRIKKALE